MTAHSPARGTGLPRTQASGLTSGLPIAAGLLAEGAWIALPAALAQAMSGHAVILGPVHLAAIALVGYLVARRFAIRLGPARWPLVAAGLTILVAILGWLADLDVRGAVVSGDLASAIARHPAGWLAGIAIMRGIAHAGPTAVIGIGGRAVSVALAWIAVVLGAGAFLPEPQRAVFQGDALVYVTVFVAASTVGVALGRITSVAEATGFDWQPNRAWLGLLGVLVVAIVAIAIPASMAVATPVRLVLQLAPAPLLVLAFFVGLRGAWRATFAAMGVMGVIVTVLVVLSQFGQRYQPVVQAPTQFTGSDQANQVPWPAIVAWVAVLLILVALVALLVRYWMRESLLADVGDVGEERSIDTTGIERQTRQGRRQRRPSGRTPGSAADAYLALLEEIEGRSRVERAPTESAPAHAMRLRQAGLGATGLDLLAADFELERFGDVRLSDAENRRGVGRWHRLRRSLGRG